MGMELQGLAGAVNALETLKEGYGQDVAYIVGVGAEYGAYVEFGTSNMEAQPYLFPAARKAVRTELPQIEQEARFSATPMEYIVSQTAQAIEAEAKPKAPVDTGFLHSSIQAYPAGQDHPGPKGSNPHR